MMVDEVNAESACKTYEEFFGISIPTRMHLNTGILKFEIWRQCLGGQARRHLDAIIPTLGVTTITNFNTVIATWFTKYMGQELFERSEETISFISERNSLKIQANYCLHEIHARICSRPCLHRCQIKYGIVPGNETQLENQIRCLRKQTNRRSIHILNASVIHGGPRTRGT